MGTTSLKYPVRAIRLFAQTARADRRTDGRSTRRLDDIVVQQIQLRTQKTQRGFGCQQSRQPA